MTWSAEQATQELLQILPLLNRVIGAEVRAVAGEDTTMAQYRVLAQLAEEPRTLSTLAKWRRVSLQSMSGLVQALVERGWVERMPDPRDRRQQLLQLTGHGHKHYLQAQTQILRRLIPLMAALTPGELEAVAQALPALGRVFAPDDEDGAEARLEGLAE
jgi:DNA-binding MarR family transcriptional regulator